MTKQFNNEYGNVYVSCHEAAVQLECEIDSEDVESGIIDFTIGASLLSFGEKFRIEIKEIKPKQIDVTVSSRPAAFFQLISWGKNWDNVDDFFELLTSKLKQ